MLACAQSAGEQGGKHPEEHTCVSLATNNEHMPTLTRSRPYFSGITVAPLRAVAIEPPAVAPPAQAAKPDWEAEFRRKQ